MWGAMVAQGLQTILNISGQHQQGKAEAAAYKYQAAQDDRNAEALAVETAMQENTMRRQNRQKLSQLSAALAENGLSGGTFDRLFDDSAKNLEQDVLNMRYKGLSAMQNYKNSAALNRIYASAARGNAKTNMWASAANGAASMLGTYVMYNSAKLNNNTGSYKTLDDGLSKNILSYKRQYTPWA